MRKKTALLTLLITLAAATAATAALTACGGGGGADAPTTTPPGAASPAPGPATYAAGTEEANAFAQLNRERVQCGFGALQQDLRLDKSAGAHASFLVRNGIAWGHFEDAGLPGFTGVTEADRSTAAGYQQPVGADLAADVGLAGAAGVLRSTALVRDLLAAPYHLLSLTDSAADLGVGYKQKNQGTGETRAMNLTLGYRAAVNELDADQVYTYPCQGATVQATLADEAPRPIPLNLAQNFKLYGAPIAVRVRTGKVLSLTGATITPTGGGSAIQAQIVDRSNDPNGGAFLRGDTAFVLPLSPLQAGTSYTVTVTGTSDGVVFTKTFSFSTAN